MLPVGPAGYGDSPCSAHSSFADSPLLVDLDVLPCPPDLLRRRGKANVDTVDFEAATAFRDRHLRLAFEAFARRPKKEHAAFRRFVGEQGH